MNVIFGKLKLARHFIASQLVANPTAFDGRNRLSGQYLPRFVLPR